MEEKEIIKEILNEIVEKVVNSVRVERVIVQPSSHQSSEPWSGSSYEEPAPEHVSYSPCGIFRVERRGIPPPRKLECLKNLDMNSELYINEKDEQDEIIVNVPEKYKNYKITQLGDAMLMKFLSEIHKIREDKLSLRGITLSRVPILHIYDPNTENVKISTSMMQLPKMIRPIQKPGPKYSAVYTLYLNVGLNPYIYFNDYYISHINSTDLKNPIIILKRYLKYNPNIRDNLIPINFPTNLELKSGNFTSDGKKRIKDRFFRTYSKHNWEDYNETVTVVATGRLDKRQGGDYLVGFMLEELRVDKSECMFKHNLASSIKLINKFERSSDKENYMYDNLTIWKYGREILKEIYMCGVNSVVVGGNKFEWFKKKKKREYDLVKESTFIFEKPTILLQALAREDELEYDEKLTAKKIYEIKKGLENMNDKSNIILGSGERDLDLSYNINSYRERLLNEDYYNVKKRLTNKLGILSETKSCNKYLKKVFYNYIKNVQKYLLEGDDIYIRKYLKEKNLFDEVYDNETLYQELLNEGCFKLLEKSLEKYDEEIINNDIFELQTPDIYILLGFHELPSKFSAELWGLNDFANENSWFIVIYILNLLESTAWYYMYGVCCFFAQLVGPSYYIYSYYLIDKNDYCPNNSSTLNKFFAIGYYLVLYARMNGFWRSLTTTTWQYGNTTLITNNNYLRLTLIINSLCLFIIPLFTYTLFIEMSNVTDLILNCLTGEFLINIDNLIIEFIGEEDYIKSITKELLVLSFIEKGFPVKNIMEGNTRELWLITVLQVLQMFGTLIMTGIVYKCI